MRLRLFRFLVTVLKLETRQASKDDHHMETYTISGEVYVQLLETVTMLCSVEKSVSLRSWSETYAV
jgi:hypothetical protein